MPPYVVWHRQGARVASQRSPILLDDSSIIQYVCRWHKAINPAGLGTNPTNMIEKYLCNHSTVSILIDFSHICSQVRCNYYHCQALRISEKIMFRLIFNLILGKTALHKVTDYMIGKLMDFLAAGR